MKRKLHKYTAEEVKWMKDCVLPPYQDKLAKESLASQFNQTFGTSISTGAFYVKAAVVQGKYKDKSKKRPISKAVIRKAVNEVAAKESARIAKNSKEKKHLYTPDEVNWILQHRGWKISRENRAMKNMAKYFNKTFGTHITPGALYVKARRLFKKLDAGKIRGFQPSRPARLGEKIPYTPTYGEKIQPGGPGWLEKTIASLEASFARIPPSSVNPKLVGPGKFKVIVGGEVVWAGDEKPVVKSFPLFFVVVNGKICQTSRSPLSFEVVQSL